MTSTNEFTDRRLVEVVQDLDMSGRSFAREGIRGSWE